MCTQIHLHIAVSTRLSACAVFYRFLFSYVKSCLSSYIMIMVSKKHVYTIRVLSSYWLESNDAYTANCIFDNLMHNEMFGITLSYYGSIHRW